MSPVAAAVVRVTGLCQLVPDFTDACNPPEGGVKRTAEVLPLVATATVKPFATNCGELHVCAMVSAEQITTLPVTSVAKKDRDRRAAFILYSFVNSRLFLGSGNLDPDE
jgi:hypothetical protein